MKLPFVRGTSSQRRDGSPNFGGVKKYFAKEKEREREPEREGKKRESSSREDEQFVLRRIGRLMINYGRKKFDVYYTKKSA